MKEQAQVNSSIRERWSKKLHTALDVEDFEGFKKLWLHVLPHITPDLLLSDKEAQIKLRDTLVAFRHATQRRKDPPIVELHSSGTNHAGTPGYSFSMRERMKLRDSDNTYLLVEPDYKPTHGARNELPTRAFLSPAIDVSAIELWRVPNGEGPVEVYNASDGRWEPNKQYEHRGLNIGNRRMNGVNLSRRYGN